MRVIVDLACKGFSHEMFNAGTVNQIHLAFPQDKVKYFAESEQLSCVKKIIEKEYKTTLKKCIFDFIEFESIDFVTNENSESKIIQEIIKKNKGITSIIITSHTLTRMHELYSVMKDNENIKFLLLLHGQLEYLLQKNGIPKYRLPLNMNYRLVVRQCIVLSNWIRRPVTSKKQILFFKKYLEYMATLDNVDFIVFSNEYKKYTQKIAEKILNKMNVFHLPYVYDFTLKINKPDAPLKIGLMPSTMYSSDAYGVQLIDYIYSHNKMITSDYLFKFVSGRIETWAWKHMKKHISLTHKFPLSREKINQLITGCDWVLLPYDKEKYKLSSSGIFFDAINMEVPVIMGPSNCFNDYDQYSVGIHADSFSSLKKELIQIINQKNEQKYLQYKKNIQNLKWKMNNHNVESFKKLL